MDKKDIVAWNSREPSKKQWLNFMVALMTTAGVLATNLSAAQSKAGADTTKQKKSNTTMIKTDSLPDADTLLVEDKLNHKQIIEDFCERILLTYGQEKWMEIIRYHLFKEINTIRKQHGLQPLKQSVILNMTAQKHAKYMFENNRYEHDTKEGTSSRQRMKNAWYKSSYMEENIDKWFTSISKTVSDRMNEKDHREMVLDPKIDEVGIGFYGWEMMVWKISQWVGFFVMDAGKED